MDDSDEPSSIESERPRGDKLADIIVVLIIMAMLVGVWVMLNLTFGN